MLSGVLRYVETPYARNVEEPPAVWNRGHARLLDYGTAAHGEPVLFVPSLINRYYILDLEEDRSLLRYMAAQGISPFVLDWRAPGKYEAEFGCEEYIAEILLPAIEFLHHSTGKKVTLVGYCMGGVLATAAAALRPKQVGKLALLATPWDFHCASFAPFIFDAPRRDLLASAIAASPTLSSEIVQALFYLTDPFVFDHKFRRFAALHPESSDAHDFIALERWVNDGVAMTSRVANDCMMGWVQENALAKGKWTVAGKSIEPQKIKMPVFIAIPKNDHVVPHDCAMALARAIPKAQTIHPGSGHVGMIVGRQSSRELWQPLAQWLRHN